MANLNDRNLPLPCRAALAYTIGLVLLPDRGMDPFVAGSLVGGILVPGKFSSR